MSAQFKIITPQITAGGSIKWKGQGNLSLLMAVNRTKIVGNITPTEWTAITIMLGLDASYAERVANHFNKHMKPPAHKKYISHNRRGASGRAKGKGKKAITQAEEDEGLEDVMGCADESEDESEDEGEAGADGGAATKHKAPEPVIKEEEAAEGVEAEKEVETV